MKLTNLKGKIKSIKYINIEEKDTTKKAEIKYKKKLSYNYSGNVIEIIEYSLGYPIERITLNYNSKGLLIDQNYYRCKSHGFLGNLFLQPWKKEAPLSTRVIANYDDTDKLTEFTEFSKDGSILGKTTYSYDKNGIRNEKDYDLNGLLIEERMDLMDSSGTHISRDIFDSNGILISKEFFIYNHDGNCIEENIIKLDGSPELRTKITVDKEGNETELIQYDLRSGDSFQIRNEYQYDEQGNWVSRTEFHNGEFENYEKREIQYFE